MNSNIILSVQKLNKKYISGAGIKNINFDIEAGTIVRIIGLNGAGKTTLFSCITDVEKKDSGNVLFQGEQIGNKGHEIFQDIGIVTSEQGYPEDFTADRISKIMRGVYKNWNNRIFKQILKDFEVNMKEKIGNYSTGMKSKLSIALSLSHEPKMLILDEPTNGLDVLARKHVCKYLYEFVQHNNNAILLSSHIITDIEKIADRIILIHQGEIILDCIKDDLLYKYGTYHITSKQFEDIDKALILRYKKQEMFTKILVENKNEVEKKYGIERDIISIESIVELFLEGEIVKC